MYDRFPFVRVSDRDADCKQGWIEIGTAIREQLGGHKGTVCVECYPGTLLERLLDDLTPELRPDYLIRADS